MRLFPFLIALTLWFSPAFANTELIEVITEIAVNNKAYDLSKLEQRGVSKALKSGLLQAAQKLSRQRLNSNILSHYQKMYNPQKKGYVHGYSIVSKHYNEKIGIYNAVFKITYFSTPIRSDIINFGLQQNVSTDTETVFLISARLLNDSPDAIISLSNIISEEFEFRGTRGSFLVKGENAFQNVENLHKKYRARLIIAVNLAFSQDESSGDIRGYLSYKVIDKSNKTIKAMSFSEDSEATGVGEENESIYTLTRSLMQNLLDSYSK